MCVYLPWLTGSRLGPLGKDFLGAILIEKLFSAPPSQAGNILRSIQTPNWWYYLVFHFSNVTRVEMRDASRPVAVNALSPCANLKWMPARSYNVPCYYLSLIRVTIPNYSVLSAFSYFSFLFLALATFQYCASLCILASPAVMDHPLICALLRRLLASCCNESGRCSGSTAFS